MEILEIYWNYFSSWKSWKPTGIYKASWKFSGLVCEFVHLSLILPVVTILVFQSVSVQNISW